MNRYKYIEKVLYSYSSNIEKQAEYAEELEYLDTHGDLKVQRYSEGTGGGEVSDRVLDYVHRKHVLEKRLARLNLEVWSVGSLIERLEDMKDSDEYYGKLYAVFIGVYMQGITEGIKNVADDEVPELRRKLVRMVSRRMEKYEHIISAS